MAVAGTNPRIWFFILAFVCIGLEFRPAAVREAGLRPVAVFAIASVGNLVLALLLASLLFSGFKLARLTGSDFGR